MAQIPKLHAENIKRLQAGPRRGQSKGTAERFSKRSVGI